MTIAARELIGVLYDVMDDVGVYALGADIRYIIQWPDGSVTLDEQLPDEGSGPYTILWMEED